MATRCPRCGSENPHGKRFCADCGAVLGSRCPKCGSENPAGKKFCGDCGVSLGVGVHPGTLRSPGAPSIAPDVRIASEQSDASTAADGERKTVTTPFADIKVSMELMEDFDPEEARAIIDPALMTMDAAHCYSGHAGQHAQRALQAALAVQNELRRCAGHLRRRIVQCA